MNNIVVLFFLFLFAGLFQMNLSNDINFTEPLIPNTGSHVEFVDDASMSGKHESLFECDLFELEPDEFVMYSNGSVFVPVYNQTYDEPYYKLVNNYLRICVPPHPATKYNALTRSTISFLSWVGVIISMVCLLLHLMVFSLVPDLKNLPGYNLASLCASLFMSYLFMIISETQKNTGSTMCTISGVLTHFFFMASFLWMLVMAFDVFRSILLATGSMRLSNKEFKMKKFFWYSLFSWFAALAFTIAAVAADNMDSLAYHYRPIFRKSCWFENKSSLLIFFAVPVGIITSLNFIMFGISAFMIFTNRMKTSHESQRSSLKKNHLLYFRLTVIMGVTWITGLLAPIVEATWLWYVFAALNTLQGLFIFLAFTCSPKVKKIIKEKLFKARRSSQQTLSPTFQSYCFYANSIEKDLDKVVDSKDSSVPTDTIVIHL